jgi:hypothetical protein
MPKTGLDGLLRPEDSVLALVDHQAFQFANLHSHEPTRVSGRAQRRSKTSPRFFSTTRAVPVLYLQGKCSPWVPATENKSSQSKARRLL